METHYMLYRLLTILFLLTPLTAGAVYFPAGIDWTHPSQLRFVQSLYLNMLGRAPGTSETQRAVQTLRRLDNRTTRLRAFETLLQSSEYQQLFKETDRSWQVYQAQDYNHTAVSGNQSRHYVRHKAAQSTPQGFTNLPRDSRSYSESVARSIAAYHDAFCYRGKPCIDNPELARTGDARRNTKPHLSRPASNVHACADESALNTRFKWVAINGTTYPHGTDRLTICLQDAYFKASQLNLERYECDPGYTNCRRNSALDLRASRSGTDKDGYPAFFFRDGSRLALIENDHNRQQPTDPLLANDAHVCADASRTNSRFTWQSNGRNTESKGVGTTIVCMQQHYYEVQRRLLRRYNCDIGYTNCRPDPNNNLTATRSTRINGNPALVFPNGTTLTITSRSVDSGRPSNRTNRSSTKTDNNPDTGGTRQRTNPVPRARTDSNEQVTVNGSQCADSKRRLSQFRWKSQGLSSWPDGIDGRIICLNDSYYEVTASVLRNYSCQRNYSNCIANPGKNVGISTTSEDGTIWTLSNGDEVTLISR